MGKCLSAPTVSNPTPTPIIRASIVQAKRAPGSFLSISLVDTMAQFCSAAEFFFSIVSAVPKDHRPLPGGVHFKLNNLSKASFADDCAL